MFSLQKMAVIKHRGTVESIDGTHVKVKIVQSSACASCSVKGFCGSADRKEKIIDVYDAAHPYMPGDAVLVCEEQSMGMRAVVIAFVVPFVILLAVLFMAMRFSGGNELLSALLSLLVLVPYYTLLYLLRNRIRRNFSFTLKPINN